MLCILNKSSNLYNCTVMVIVCVQHSRTQEDNHMWDVDVHTSPMYTPQIYRKYIEVGSKFVSDMYKAIPLE